MKTHTRGLRAIRVAAALIAVGAGCAAAGPADASTIGNCTAIALNPAPIATGPTGYKFSKGSGLFKCATARTLQVNVQLVADDLYADDVIVNSVGTFSMAPNVGRIIHSSWGLCNEDSPGADELYSKVRARISVGSNAYTTWSAWDRGPTVTYNC